MCVRRGLRISSSKVSWKEGKESIPLYELSLKSRDQAWLFATFENPGSTMVNIDDCSFKVLDCSISFLTQKKGSLFRRQFKRIQDFLEEAIDWLERKKELLSFSTTSST